MNDDLTALFFQIRCRCGALFVPLVIAPPVVETTGTCPHCLTEHVITFSVRVTAVPDDLSSLDQ